MTPTGPTTQPTDQVAGRSAEHAAGQPGTRRQVREALARARARDEEIARTYAGAGHEPGHGPMSEREFWRARARQAETEISTRCC